MKGTVWFVSSQKMPSKPGFLHAQSAEGTSPQNIDKGLITQASVEGQRKGGEGQVIL